MEISGKIFAEIEELSSMFSVKKNLAHTEYSVLANSCDEIPIMQRADNPLFQRKLDAEAEYFRYRRILDDLQYVKELLDDANEKMKEAG